MNHLAGELGFFISTLAPPLHPRPRGRMIFRRLAGQDLHEQRALETPPNRPRKTASRAARVVRRRVNAGAELMM